MLTILLIIGAFILGVNYGKHHPTNTWAAFKKTAKDVRANFTSQTSGKDTNVQS